MARELTQAAQAAKMIRQNLRAQGLDCTVRSGSVDNSISDAVRERVYQWLRQNWLGGDELPDTYEAGRNMLLDHSLVCDRVSWLFYTADSPYWHKRPFVRMMRQGKAA